MTSDSHREFEAHSAILEAVVSRYPVGSKEYETVKLAALALYFATVRHSSEFSRFLKLLEQGLTEKDRGFLKKLGMD
jgi:hypothetical protein